MTARRTHSQRAASAQQARSKRAACTSVCMYVCIQEQNTVTYMQICIAFKSAYVYVSACMSVECSGHTCTYALDTAPMSQRYIQIQCNTCRYKFVHITYALCICDMHSVVSCAYVCAYVCVSFSHTYHINQCISVMYVYVVLAHMHWQDH